MRGAGLQADKPGPPILAHAAHYATLRSGMKERLDFKYYGCAKSTVTTALYGPDAPCTWHTSSNEEMIASGLISMHA